MLNLEIEVEFNFSKGRKGQRDSLGGKAGAGPPLEPDDPDEIEITAVNLTLPTSPGCKPVLKDISDLLTKEQLDQIEEEAWEQLSERDEP